MRALDAALLLLRELRRPREVDLADPARAALTALLPLRELALLGRLDERRELLG